MKLKALTVLALLGAAALALPARADTTPFSFSGPGVSGQGTLTFTPGVGGADKITGITGVFSDSNTGLNGKSAIVNAPITGLVPVNPVNPLPSAVLAPDFSYYPIANGVPAPPASQASTSLSYDNTFYPAGSPIVCTDYPASGGFFDVYGLLFTISDGNGTKAVELWSNGDFPGSSDPAIYGIAVADSNFTYDYVNGGVTASVPEPSTLAFVALAIAGLTFSRRRTAPRAL